MTSDVVYQVLTVNEPTAFCGCPVPIRWPGSQASTRSLDVPGRGADQDGPERHLVRRPVGQVHIYRQGGVSGQQAAVTQPAPAADDVNRPARVGRADTSQIWVAQRLVPLSPLYTRMTVVSVTAWGFSKQ